MIDDSGGNVIDINKNKKGPRYNKQDFYGFACSRLFYGASSPHYYQCPKPLDRELDKYYIVEEDGVRYPLKDKGNGVVYRVGLETLASEFQILFDINDPGRVNGWGSLGVDDASKCAKYYIRTMPLIAMPPLLKFAGEDGLAFHEVPFEKNLPWEGKTPLWDEFCSRVNSPEGSTVLQADIGSIFFPEVETQNYLWLFGDGANGKSCILSMLADCLGPAAKSDSPPAAADKFWTSGLLNKRLLYIDDFDRPRWVQSGTFKSLTGGSRVRVEIKQLGSFDTNLNLKMILASNQKPQLSNSDSDLRRARYVEIAPVGRDKIDPRYKDRLKEESPYIVSKCMSIFEKCGRIVPTDEEAILAVDNEQHIMFESVMDEYFFVADDVPAGKRTEQVTAEQLSRILRQNAIYQIHSNQGVGDFKNWMRIKYGVKSKKYKVDGRVFPSSYLERLFFKVAGHDLWLCIKNKPEYGKVTSNQAYGNRTEN